MTISKTSCRFSLLLGEILNRHIGRGQQLSVADLAKRAGVSVAIIYETQRGAYKLPLTTAMKIVQALPDEAAEEWHNASGFFGCRRTEASPISHREFHATVAQTSASYAEFFSDDQIDHREECQLRHRILPRLSSMLARVRVGA